jgi:hypothetical protein
MEVFMMLTALYPSAGFPEDCSSLQAKIKVIVEKFKLISEKLSLHM